eukprot:COSAG06_NODE_99_length_24156_cov_20.889549_3_plen_41_part_00
MDTSKLGDFKVGRREGGLAALADLIGENCFLCASAVPLAP